MRCLQTLGPIEKQVVLSFKRDGVDLADKHKNKDQTHKPEIDARSANIVQNSELNGVDVVQRLNYADI